MTNLHEKLANALDAFADVWDKSPFNVSTPPAPQRPPVEKVADDLVERYRRVTGEEIDAEALRDPVARKAIEKMAVAASPVNQLGGPADQDDPKVRKSASAHSGSREEKRDLIYRQFGEDLLAGEH